MQQKTVDSLFGRQYHSFSPVIVGHVFGPASLESEDNLIKLDGTLADLISFVNEKIGLENVLHVLPTGMLWFNSPLSFFEAFIGAFICAKFF